MWKTKDHNVSETGCVSVFRCMGQDKPTQLGPLERASLNHSDDSEDGDDMFFRNVGWLSTDCTALCPRRYNSY
jgi:hypothetical protein